MDPYLGPSLCLWGKTSSQNSALLFLLHLPQRQPLGKSLPLLRRDPRVISVLFKTGCLLQSQLVCGQAAGLGREPHTSTPPEGSLQSSLCIRALLPPQAQPPVSLLWDIPSSAPSSLMVITYALHFLLPNLLFFFSLPFFLNLTAWLRVHSCNTHTYAHTHTCAHTAVECVLASGVYGSGTCASCHLPEYLAPSTVPFQLLWGS